MISENKFVVLKDLVFKFNDLKAFGRAYTPATHSTPEFFILTVWLLDTTEAINVMYEDVEERDSDYDLILKALGV